MKRSINHNDVREAGAASGVSRVGSTVVEKDVVEEEKGNEKDEKRRGGGGGRGMRESGRESGG